VRLSDATDQRAEAAMATLRAEYEARLAERTSEQERMRQELDQLRQVVRGLEQDARVSPDEQATAVLDALAAGDMLPATDVLRRKVEDRLAVAGEARREAASAARQLGSMLKLFDSAGALKAFRQAAECDPEDFWTWIEIARLEQIVGNLAGARQAAEAALLLETGDERSRSVAYNDVGDVQQAQGDLAAALTSYRASLAISERLAQADPGNAGWQRDLSVSQEKIGDVQQAQGASRCRRRRSATCSRRRATWRRR
jgi:tetratricopeptide (TPR) repeat protein